jgi:hypothetical protein
VAPLYEEQPLSKPCRYQCGRNTEKGTSRCRTCRRNDRKSAPSVIRPGGPRILLIDIETSLQLSYHFGQWGVNINPELTVEPTRMLCFAAKWLGEPGTKFYSEWTHGRAEMVAAAWLLLDEADAVVHYYGSRFDVPHLNREFFVAGLTPPSPFKQVDLKFAVSKRFKFDSNKLEFISRACGLDGKLKHEGAMLWRKVQEGDAAAQGRMESYNRRDTDLLEECYERLLPWIPNPPHRHLYDGEGACPNCGQNDMQETGEYTTALSVYKLFTCNACGSWFRPNKRLYGVKLQAAVLS